MTCVVALKHDNKIYMGADSLISSQDNTCSTPYGPNKLLKINNFLFGFSGSPKYQNEIIINNSVIDSNKTEEEMGLFCHQHLQNQKDNNSFILLSKGKSIIWAGSNGFYQYHTYYATGLGYQLALGSLATTENLISNPYERLKLALASSEKHSTCVSSPFIYEEIN